MELRLLGPPELIIEHRPVDLGGPRQRIVLCVLALNANRVTPVEQLLDALWGEAPPTTARGQVQICVSALRKVFAQVRPNMIRTQPPGYMLMLEPDELDVGVFDARVRAGRELAAAGRDDEAATELRAALALWRGTALAGISSAQLDREATMLEERRNVALEERLRLDLALGRHRELVGELRALIAERPLTERLHEYLMRALYRCGRQAEALEAGRRIRALLAEELGVDPSQELQQAEHDILTGAAALNQQTVQSHPLAHRPAARAGATGVLLDPTGILIAQSLVGPVDDPPDAPAAAPAQTPTVALDPAARLVIPRQLPPSIADFTGREDLLKEIRNAMLAEGDSYAMRIVAISGRGGVGKSTLAVRAAHELVEHFPDGQLYAELEASDVDGGTTRQLARFLRALGVSGSAIPDDPLERMELYRSHMAERRILLIIDNAACEDQVLPLLPGGPHCGVITTSRARMTGLPGARCVTVDVLDDEQSIHMLARVIGEERVRTEHAAGRDLVDLCARLPLALRIAGARLASRPHWRLDDLVRRLSDESRRLDEFVHKGLELRSNIGMTYAALDPRAQALFRLCALIRAPDLPSWVAAALLDTTLVEGEDLLERLVDAQLLKVVTVPNEHVRRYRFHDLVRVYAMERLAQTERPEQLRAALIRVLGGWLHLSDEAHRWQYGGDDTVLHGTAPRWNPPDAPLPERIADSMQWWERERRGLVPAIRQAAAAGLDEACWDLALTSITLFETKGYHDDWRETATVAFEAATTAGNERGRAAAQYSLGTLALSQKRLDLAEQHFTKALDLFVRIDDRHGRALVLRNAAFISRVRGDAAVLDRYDEALAAMREVGDRIGEAHVLASLAKLHIDHHDHSLARGMLDEAARICRESGCLRVEAQVVYRLGELHLATGQLDLAREALHRTLRVVRDLGDRTGEAYALHAIGVVRTREGRFDIAEHTLAHSLRLARTVGDRWIEAQTLFEMAQNAIAQEEHRLADDLLAEALALFVALDAPMWQARSLLLRAELARVTEVRTVARAMTDQAAILLERMECVESAEWRQQLRALQADLDGPASSA